MIFKDITLIDFETKLQKMRFKTPLILTFLKSFNNNYFIIY